MVSPYMENGNVNMYLKEYPNADRVQMVVVLLFVLQLHGS